MKKFGMGENFSKLFNLYNNMNLSIPIKRVYNLIFYTKKN